jgi:hypothetical protein
MKINRVKDFEAKRNRRTFETNSYVNNQHHAQKRRFERQMMNRVNQKINYFKNHFSMTNKIIFFYETDTRRKSFFAHLRQIETTSYVMKRKSITK